MHPIKLPSKSTCLNAKPKRSIRNRTDGAPMSELYQNMRFG
jgi:hypothetical protein